MKRPAINIVATCTKRKTVPAPRNLSLGRIRINDPKARSDAWIDALNESTSATLLASELYCGDQWQVVRSLRQVGAQRGIDVNIWVCSAGYGLIPADSYIHPYSATFSMDHADSVCRTRRADRTAIHTAWWSLLANWKGPMPEQPRSLAQLAGRFASQPLVVVASPTYIQAVQDDIISARKQLRSPDLLAIISAGAENLASLAENQIPCDSRFQHWLGGALMSLNPRIAREMLVWLKSNEWNLTRLKLYFATCLAKQPSRPRYERTQMSDEELRRFVLEESPKHPVPSASRLLRLLRDSGFACEQKRFGRIFEQIQDLNNGR